jgi:hypothetical protein
MNSKKLVENPFFTIKSPEEYRQLSVALSYARGRLSDKIKAEKLERYKLIKGTITEQLIKREALRQLAEFDNFLSKNVLDELLENNEAQEQQQINANVVEIAPVGGIVIPPAPVEVEPPAPVEVEAPAQVQEEPPAPVEEEEPPAQAEEEAPAPRKPKIIFKKKQVEVEEEKAPAPVEEEELELEPIVIIFNDKVLEGTRAKKREFDKQKKFAKNSLDESIEKRLSTLKNIKNKIGLSAGAEQFIDKNIVILENELKYRAENAPRTNPELLSKIQKAGFKVYVNAGELKLADSRLIYDMIMDEANRTEVRKAINDAYTRNTGKLPKGKITKGFGLEKTNKIKLMIGSAMAGNNNKNLLRKIR